MTTIACWFSKEGANAPPSIWVCADSMVSSSCAKTLIESSPKIFAIPVRCFVPGASGFFDTAVLNTTIGVAYAGNSLVGLTFNSALSACLARLNSVSTLPSLDDIAEFSSKLLQMYVKQLAFNFPDNAVCEIALVGFCPVESRRKICHLMPSVNSGSFHYHIATYLDTQDDDFVLVMGTDTRRIKENIRLVRMNSEKNRSWWQAPKNVISNEVKGPSNNTIGGHLQLGIGTDQGFELYSVAQPDNCGGGNFLGYLGVDLSGDFGRIGTCVVGMTGMI
jgi:hypothetical protein